MPNWCSNRFVVHGDKGQLLKFYMDMSAAISDHPNFQPVDNSWDHMWVGNLFLGAGYSEADVESGNISCRGGIESITLEDNCVIIDDETAWSPNAESMQQMLDEKYPGLEMVFRSEEPGNVIYINTDESGEYLPERYIIDGYCDGSYFEDCYEYYNDDETLFEALSNISGVPAQDIRNVLGDMCVEDFDWTEWIRKVKNIPEDKDCYLGVHEYTSD